MNTIDPLSLLKKDILSKYYSYLDLPSEWEEKLHCLSDLVLKPGVIQELYIKAAAELTGEKKPDFSNWNDPVIDGVRRPDFFLLLSLLAVSYVLENHRKTGIPEEVTRETCRGIGTKSRDYFFFHNEPGTVKQAIYWFRHHMEGRLYKLGRFEFMLRRSSEVHETLKDILGDDKWIMDMHIPGGGSMNPAVSLDSWKRGLAFYEKYFPEKPIAAVVCVSWIFSPDLPDFLKPESNLLKLCAMVHINDGGGKREGSNFVMGTSSDNPEDWPENTSLQRAYKEHIQSGGLVRLGVMHLLKEEILSMELDK